MRQAAILTVTLLCLCWSMAARAMVCAVPGGYATIQLAVDDTACTEIKLAAGAFNGATVERDLTIRGESRATSIINSTMTIDAPTVLDVVILSLRNLSVQSTGSFGVLLNNKFVELDGEDIDISLNGLDGISHAPGAADSVVRLRNCDIHQNRRGILARVIDMDDCNVTLNAPNGGIRVGLGGKITNSNISSNQNTVGVEDGGGIVFDFPSGGTTLTIEDSTISSNVVNNGGASSNTADGGGIMVRSGFLFLRRSHVLGNTAGRFGGGLAMGKISGVAEVEDSTFIGNIAYGAGGGIALHDRAEIRRSLIENNRAWFNSAVNSNGLAVGGGIYVAEDRLDLVDSTVRQNKAEAEVSGISINSGGGLYINTNLPVTIDNTTIDENFAEVDGGGLYVNSTTTMTNTTIAGNSANQDGGGIYGNTPPTLIHGTVVENTADADSVSGGDGGGIFGSAQVDHTLIGYNIDTSGVPLHPDCSGAVVSFGFSFLRIGDGCAGFINGTSGNQVGSGGLPFELGLLLPIANNGGPTQTAALDGLSSPARDAGQTGCETVTAMDQRGISRVAQDGNGDNGVDGNPCDVGAFEVFSGCQAAPLVLSNITYSDTRSVRSESTLSTGNDVVIDTTADIAFEAGSSIAIGNGFRVLSGAQFAAGTGIVSCT